jgi:hypothetical protein
MILQRYGLVECSYDMFAVCLRCYCTVRVTIWDCCSEPLLTVTVRL